MSDQTNNLLFGIDKYSGTFEQDELGVTQIPTETIQLLNDFTLLALFTFLASRSRNWKINAKHLAKHFNCNKDKIYKAIEALIKLGLLSRSIIRDKGKFANYHYRLHLRQIVQVTPCLEKPDTVKPDTVNPDTYKTYILPLENKEKNTTTTEPPPENIKKPVVVVNNSSKTLTSHETQKLSEAFYNNPMQSRCINNLDDFLSAAIYSIMHREETITRHQRLHGIIKLLKQGVFEEPPLWAMEQKSRKKVAHKETEEEYYARIKRYKEENAAEIKKAWGNIG